jgi:hypothetical protein
LTKYTHFEYLKPYAPDTVLAGYPASRIAEKNNAKAGYRTSRKAGYGTFGGIFGSTIFPVKYQIIL